MSQLLHYPLKSSRCLVRRSPRWCPSQFVLALVFSVLNAFFWACNPRQRRGGASREHRPPTICYWFLCSIVSRGVLRIGLPSSLAPPWSFNIHDGRRS